MLPGITLPSYVEEPVQGVAGIHVSSSQEWKTGRGGRIFLFKWGMIVTYSIETSNNYMRFALESLYLQNRYSHRTCIIDVTSFYSIKDIIHCVRRNVYSTRFMFIGDAGVHSRALLPLITIESKWPLPRYYEAIRHCPGVDYETVMDILLAHRNMEHFSHREKTTVYGLLLKDSMIDAANEIGVRPKLFYQRVDRLAKMLNMRSRLQVLQFFKYEYHPSFVLAKINNQVRVSVRKQLSTW